MSAVNLLKIARDYLGNGALWQPGGIVANDRREAVPMGDPTAVYASIGGAIMMAGQLSSLPPTDRLEAVAACARVAHCACVALHGCSLSVWEDRAGRTWGDVSAFIETVLSFEPDTIRDLLWSVGEQEDTETLSKSPPSWVRQWARTGTLAQAA